MLAVLLKLVKNVSLGNLNADFFEVDSEKVAIFLEFDWFLVEIYLEACEMR